MARGARGGAEGRRALSEGRALVVPGAVSLGVRALTLPDRRNVLVVSSIFAFRLSDHAPVRPAQWYEAVASHVDAAAVADSVCVLPGAELMVLGVLGAVSGDSPREVRVRCASVSFEGLLYRDEAENADARAVVADYARAVWHEHDNPLGRNPRAGNPRAMRNSLRSPAFAQLDAHEALGRIGSARDEPRRGSAVAGRESFEAR